MAFSLCTKFCGKKKQNEAKQAVLCLLHKTLVSEKVLCVFIFLLLYYKNALMLSYSQTNIVSYRPDNRFDDFNGRSTCCLGASAFLFMFKYLSFLFFFCTLTHFQASANGEPVLKVSLSIKTISNW